jgi:hypothetical protein
MWLVVWFFKARAVIRAGRPVYPVSESRSIKIVRVPYAVPTQRVPSRRPAKGAFPGGESPTAQVVIPTSVGVRTRSVEGGSRGLGGAGTETVAGRRVHEPQLPGDGGLTRPASEGWLGLALWRNRRDRWAGVSPSAGSDILASLTPP